MAADAEFQVLANRMDRIGEDVVEIKDQVRAISQGLEKIARLEERHENHARALERAFNSLTSMEGRLKTLEVQEPINKMVSKWVIAGVLGVVAILGVQIVGLAFMSKGDKAPQPVHITIDRGGEVQR